MILSDNFNITDNGTDPAEVKVSLNADLNPMLKMMAAKPIEQFLEDTGNRNGECSGMERD